MFVVSLYIMIFSRNFILISLVCSNLLLGEQVLSKPISENTSTPPEIIFQILASEIALLSGNIPSAALTYLDVASKTKDIGAAKRATELALAIGDNETALKGATIWLTVDKTDVSARETVKVLLLVTEKYDQLMQILAAERETFRGKGNVESFYNELSVLVNQTKNVKKSLEIFENISKKDQTLPNVMYSKAMLYYRNGDSQKMEEILRNLVNLKPDHAQALNALGYSMADANNNLKEAQRLIKAALRFAPQDPHIIDSMGWINFRLGNLELAKKWLEKAYDSQPDAEISAHYGEVLWALSQREFALKIFSSGFKKNPSSSILLDTLTRLKISVDQLRK